MRDHEFGMKCAVCGVFQGRAFNLLGDGSPEDGSVLICDNCGAVLICDSTRPGFSRLPTAREALEIVSDQEFRTAALTWALVHLYETYN